MKIQNVKRVKLNKIGTVAAVLILCCISFTAGVDLTQNANSAGSASVLPIAKGGTGGNTASIAATNILGTNFENYSGILPLAKGGIGVDASTPTGKSTAQGNLNVPQSFTYPLNYAIPGDPVDRAKYLKFASVQAPMPDQNDSRGNIVVNITGLTTYGSAMVSYIATLSSRAGSQVLTGINTCDQRGAFYIDLVNEDGKKYQRDYYIAAGGYLNETRITILSNNTTNNPSFTIGAIKSSEKPADAVNFYAGCMTISPGPISTP
jgi:hypothetical protein